MGLFGALAYPAVAADAGWRLTSPDRHISVAVSVQQSRDLSYEVKVDGRPLIAPSPLGLVTADGSLSEVRVADGRYTKDVDRYALNGPVSHVVAPYSQLALHVKDGAGRQMDVVFRAYNDGIAYRYVVPAAPDLKVIAIKSEKSAFRFASTSQCFASVFDGYHGPHEGTFVPFSVDGLAAQKYIDNPLVCKTGNAAIAIAEADVTHYAGSYLQGTGNGVQVNLSPRLDGSGDAVRYAFQDGALKTPWRVVMIAPTVGKLTESTLIYTLGSRPESGNWAWVRPGKTAWDWWSGYAVPVAHPGPNSETERAFIDFAQSFGFPYLLIDDGWYQGSTGGGQFHSTDDITISKPEMNIPALVAYGTSKQVDIFLWVHWMALDRQMEAAMAQFEAWGVKGIKVDFMDRNDQDMVDFYHRVLAMAAKHHLMVDLHGAYPPNGLARTYPNFVTQEAVRGAEVNKWWAGATAQHNMNLAYTRMLLGPADYTPGGFRNLSPTDFAHQVRSDRPFTQTTRGQALGLFVIMQSPVMTVADSPDAYVDPDGQLAAGADFVKGVPTTWDETRFIAGDIGAYVALARRKDATWTLGVLNGSTARTAHLPLAFLGKGKFTARIYADGDSPQALSITDRTVDARGVLDLDLAATGGGAITFTPIH